ncbi:odhB, partial [Symbiodinium sp. KB8]
GAAMSISLRRAWARLPCAVSASGLAQTVARRGLALGAPSASSSSFSKGRLRTGREEFRQRFGQIRFFSKVDVPTPALGGESITEGTIAEWTAKVGEDVKKDQVIATIETDKVTVDVKAPQDGRLLEIKIQADENCEVGQVLAVLGPPGEGAPAAAEAAAPAAAAPAAAPAAKAGPKVDVAVLDLGGESITEGAIAEWTAKVGQNVKKDQVIATIETDKVTVDIKAPQDGQLLEIKCQAEETVTVGQVLAVLGPPGDGVPVATEAAAPAAAAAAAAPKAAPKAAPAPKSAAAPAAASAPSSPERGERREKMTRMRQAIARNLKESQNTLAMLTTFQEVDMSGLIKMRKEYKDIFQSSHGAKLGFQSPFFLASAYALKQIPALNAYIDNATNEVVFRDYINIGFAAATPKGLVTPVIKNMETKNLAEVESEFARFAGLAKQDKLSMDDITGNTFTITNGGVFGSMLGTPLIGSINSAAALGLHATKDRAVVLPNGEIGVRPIMYLALTYDHRLVDGREAVTFLCMIRDQVEDPRRMLLEI